MGQGVQDKFLQEGDIPDPNYGGKLSDFYSSLDGTFREGGYQHYLLFTYKKNISALYVGGVKQPNSGATPLDITVKVKFDISHMLQISLIYNLFYSEYKYI